MAYCMRIRDPRLRMRGRVRRSASALVALSIMVVAAPGGWWIIDEPECHLGAHVLVTDLAGWRRERIPALPDTAWFDFAPDWVCEILSPGTARLDRVQKMPIHAEAGVECLWLVDPELRTLEAYRREGASWLLLGNVAEQDVVRVAPFDAIELELGLFWT